MPLRARLSVARIKLAAIWFAFFCLNMGIILHLYLGDWIEEDNFKSAVSELNTSYVTYLGVIVTFYLTAPANHPVQRPRDKMSHTVAILGSLIWNLTISVFIVRLALGYGTIEDSVEQVEYFSSLLSWFAAPAIGFYFANASRPGEREG
jgi:cytosine/uracil/thiamine/allantoin permease